MPGTSLHYLATNYVGLLFNTQGNIIFNKYFLMVIIVSIRYKHFSLLFFLTVAIVILEEEIYIYRQHVITYIVPDVCLAQVIRYTPI